jgi:hypothetical protein
MASSGQALEPRTEAPGSKEAVAELARCHAAVFRELAHVCRLPAKKLATADPFAAYMVPHLDRVQEKVLGVEEARWKEFDARTEPRLRQALATLESQAREAQLRTPTTASST